MSRASCPWTPPGDSGSSEVRALDRAHTRKQRRMATTYTDAQGGSRSEKDATFNPLTPDSGPNSGRGIKRDHPRR